MSLYSDGIVVKFRFQKSRFTPKNREWADTFLSHCIVLLDSQQLHEMRTPPLQSRVYRNEDHQRHSVYFCAFLAYCVL